MEVAKWRAKGKGRHEVFPRSRAKVQVTKVLTLAAGDAPLTASGQVPVNQRLLQPALGAAPPHSGTGPYSARASTKNPVPLLCAARQCASRY